MSVERDGSNEVFYISGPVSGLLPGFVPPTFPEQVGHHQRLVGQPGGTSASGGGDLGGEKSTGETIQG